jgi:hypothetical protein
MGRAPGRGPTRAIHLSHMINEIFSSPYVSQQSCVDQCPLQPVACGVCVCVCPVSAYRAVPES